MKKIKTVNSVGNVLCHDITQIIPDESKGVAFKKGHIIKNEDINILLSLGKDHVYVWKKEEGMLHENDAAVRLKTITAGKNLSFSEIKEGKIDFIADIDGLLKINKELLYKLNSIGEMVLVTLHNNYPVKKGEKVAGTRVIPLIIEDEKIKKAEKIINEKIVDILPFNAKKVSIISTGNEIYYGRIQDKFGPVIKSKVEEYDCEVIDHNIVPDSVKEIGKAIKNAISKGAQLILCTGGMSVDPDDLTPSAIRNTGAKIITYGAPILPGSMFLAAYKDEIPILGIPGCAMYSKRTIFDLMLPRVLAGDILTKEDIYHYGHGGLCINCEECRFPKCSFGKGV